MKCLRCGYCCLKLMVVIVIDPKQSDPFKEDNLKAIDQTQERCPHLKGDKPGEYKCSIHEYSWFKDTPCGTHSQIERTNSNCRIGEFILKNDK